MKPIERVRTDNKKVIKYSVWSSDKTTCVDLFETKYTAKLLEDFIEFFEMKIGSKYTNIYWYHDSIRLIYPATFQFCESGIMLVSHSEYVGVV